MTRKAKIRLKNRGSHYLGEVEMPLRGGGKIVATTLGWDPASALRRAATTAVRISTDPTIAPFVPAPVSIAAKVARKLTKMDEPELKATAATGTKTERGIAKSLIRSQPRTRSGGSPKASILTVTPPTQAQLQQQQADAAAAQQSQQAYDPYAQFQDTATQMAMQAWGEGSFADGSFARDEEESPIDDDGNPMDEAWDGMYDSEEMDPEDYDEEGEEE